MQNTPTLTKRKHNLNIETDNRLLYFHVLKQVEKRMDKYWIKIMNSLNYKFNELFSVKNENQFRDFISRLIAKQVYSMAEYDKIYESIDLRMDIEEDKLNDLIDLNFWIPDFLSSLISHSSKKTIRLILDMVKSSSGKFSKPMSIKTKETEKEGFIFKIKNVKEKLIEANPGKKTTVSAVARKLNLPRSTFVEHLQKHKLIFDEI